MWQLLVFVFRVPVSLFLAIPLIALPFISFFFFLFVVMPLWTCVWGLTLVFFLVALPFTIARAIISNRPDWLPQIWPTVSSAQSVQSNQSGSFDMYFQAWRHLTAWLFVQRDDLGAYKQVMEGAWQIFISWMRFLGAIIEGTFSIFG